MSTTPTDHYDSRGSLWHRWDLHFHTPASFDYEDKSVTNQQIVDRLIQEDVRVVAITDHHKMDVERIRALQQLGGDRLTVLPGIELRDDHGGEPVHYICIFSEDSDLDHVWTTMQGGLGLTEKSISDKGGDDKVYVPIEQGANTARTLGGVISIHAGEKSNSIEKIKNREQFQQRIKLDISREWVDLMEIGQIKDIDIHRTKIFPATGLTRPLIICSDCHNIKDYSVKAPLWFRADPTFRGLLMVLGEPNDRVHIGDQPGSVIHAEQNPTKYVRAISFSKREAVSTADRWFSGEILFNPGLVAIIGNKGSGKSALADTLGLLGATKNHDSFSFLCRERFRHPTGGRADQFEATLTWNSGETITRCLAENVQVEEVERIKYLPQHFVDKVCNEITGIDEQGFEQELEAVIFSHVPEHQRLGQTTLRELVRFQTNEKQKRIDSLLRQLRDVSRERTMCESQADPNAKRELSQKIKRREDELAAHDTLRPAAVSNPSESTEVSVSQQALLEKLYSLEQTRTELEREIEVGKSALRAAERRRAVAKRLVEKLHNFQKEFDAFVGSLEEDATEVGLSVQDLVTFNIRDDDVVAVREEAAASISALSQQLDGISPPGLRERLKDSEAQIAELHLKLDAPNRAYQVYLRELADWEERRGMIEGDELAPESLEGLKAALIAFDQLPARISQLKAEQTRLALEIHAEKLAQAEVYRTHYSAVQQFIDSHELAKHNLGLQFRVELVNEGFSERLLDMLALNRRGSFMGIDEGRALAEKFAEETQWEDIESVRAFIERVDTALHMDQRASTTPGPTQLRDQLIKGKKPEDIFELVYGLEFIRPRYVLMWEGKDISMLSPGERGTLLLVFYLLIDRGDVPLIIDQPEGNLDNLTVAKVLVDSIKSARKRRQVFIVTHSPNLAVVCDADQVIHASMDKVKGNAITYVSGSLENPSMIGYVTDVLEGTRWAFNVRDAKYQIGE
ncbi:MAG: PHP domain-containing protein [Anaerolinea sp.]|nr:PHP domain-containing protein [Anaerolinea sp.]